MQQVIVAAPDFATCVAVDELTIRIANAGPYAASVVAGDAPEPKGEEPFFRIDGEPARLRVRGWGLGVGRQDGLAKWPSEPPSITPDLDQLLMGQTCATATEAVVALIVSVLTPVARADSRSSDAGRAGALDLFLDAAKQQLAAEASLSAGVLSTELGLTLIVEDVHASCRRGTWLNVQGAAPRTGLSVPELERDVLACLEQQRLERARRGAEVAVDRAPPLSHHALGLPLASGAVVVGLGLAAGLIALAQVEQPAPFLVYSALPPVLGGVAGYALRPPGRDATWLAGYWLGVAGTSLVVGVREGGTKAVLIGGFLTAGSATSASLALANAITDATRPALPKETVILPAAVGSALSLLGLLLESEGSNSLELAAWGSLAALAPAALLALAAGSEEKRSAPQLELDLDRHAGVLRLRGEL